MTAEIHRLVYGILTVFSDRIDFYVYPGGSGGEYISNYIVKYSKYNYYKVPVNEGLNQTNTDVDLYKRVNRYHYSGSAINPMFDRSLLNNDKANPTLLELIEYTIPLNKKQTQFDNIITWFSADESHRLLVKCHTLSKAIRAMFPESIIHKPLCDNHDIMEYHDMIFFHNIAKFKIESVPINFKRYSDYYFRCDDKITMRGIDYFKIPLETYLAAYTPEATIISANSILYLNLSTCNTLRPKNPDIPKYAYHHGAFIDIYYVFALEDKKHFIKSMSIWLNDNIKIHNDRIYHWPGLEVIRDRMLSYEE